MITREELVACSIQNWYAAFAKHTFKTVILPLPADVITWLGEDGVVLPNTSAAFPARSKQEAIVAEDDYQDWTSEDECGSNAAAVPAAVTAFAADIDAAITADLEGAALPKLTWSCPKDATWVTIGNTLRCCTADEVLLLLKSSDRAMHDLTSALSECEEEAGMAQPADAGCPLGNGNACIGEETHVLALRKWYDLKPGREFRCFVVDHCLVGISQRDVTRRYPELQSELDSISDRIQTFHDSHIAGRFPLQRYTYDCYVPTSPGSNVRLIDFNPAGGTTAPLLFAWEELLADSAATQQEHDVQEDTTCSSTHKTGVRDREDVGEGSGGMRGGSEGMSAAAELRIITDDVAMRPDTAVFGVPYDFVDGSEGSALSTLLEQAKQAGAGDLFEALNQQTKQQRMRDGAG